MTKNKKAYNLQDLHIDARFTIEIYGFMILYDTFDMLRSKGKDVH